MTIYDRRYLVDPASVPQPRAFPLTSFGGLDLASDPQDVGWDGAIDLLNVDFDYPGRVRTRFGCATLATPAGGRTLCALIPYPSVAASKQLLYAYVDGTNSGLVAVDQTGTAAAALTWTQTSGLHSWTALATPANNYIYIATRDSTPRQVQRYNGTTLTAVSGKGSFVASQMPDNRLAMANFAAAADSPTGANGSKSTVFFSDAGAPETWTANNYVHLSPGDGEEIAGMATFRDQLFVFKQTAMFVFYGNSTDSTGNTEFNYRRVALPGRISDLSSRMAAGGTEALYFITDTGVYATTGGAPAEISTPLRPLFVQPYTVTIGSSFTSSVLGAPNASVSFVDGRLYVPSRSSAYSFVYDTRTKTWTVWDNSFNSVTQTPFALATGPRLYALAGGASIVDTAQKVVKIDGTATTDSGTAIASRYRTGFSDLGNPLGEKTLREILLDGYGTPTVKVAVNDGSLDTGVAVALGSSPAIGNGRRRYSARGRNFSVELSTASGAWSLSRLEGAVVSERPEGIKSA